MSAVSSLYPEDSDRIYTNPNAPPPPPSTYSMPMSSRPPPRAYADIANAYPPSSPVSVRYDNGTGQISPEVMSQIRHTGRLPKNVQRIDVPAPVLNSQILRANKPEITHAAAHQSVHGSVSQYQAYTSSANRDKRYGTQDMPLAPAPLSLPSRKKQAGSGVAGTHPPVAPIPPPKAPIIPQRPQEIELQFLATPYSPPATLPNGKQPHSYPSQMLGTLNREAKNYTASTTKSSAISTRTATPKYQGRHIANSAERAYRPAKHAKKKEYEDPVLYAAAVAAGRAMWSSMKGCFNDAQSEHSASIRRTDPYQGSYLRNESVRHLANYERQSVNKRKKQEVEREEKEVRAAKKNVERYAMGQMKKGQTKQTHHEPYEQDAFKPSPRCQEEVHHYYDHDFTHQVKTRVDPPQKAKVSQPITDSAGPVRKKPLSVKQVIGDAKKGGWWSKQGWRYGDGYWECKPKDKKGKGNSKKTEEVKYDEHGRPIETSGWYDSESD